MLRTKTHSISTQSMSTRLEVFWLAAIFGLAALVGAGCSGDGLSDSRPFGVGGPSPGANGGGENGITANPVRPILRGPTFQDILDDALAEGLSQQAYADYLQSLANAYLQINVDMVPTPAQSVISTIFNNSFGENFVMGSDGLQSIGASGIFDPASYPTVESVRTNNSVPLTGLQVWPIDYQQPGIPPVVVPVGTNPPQAYFYSATFAGSDPHVGQLLRFDNGSISQLIFIPLVSVPDGGIISAANAGAYMGMLATGAFQSTSFLDWALGQPLAKTARAAIADPGSREPTGGDTFSMACDTESLLDCMTTALLDYQTANADSAAALQAEIDQILADFAEGKGWDLAAWTAAGAVPGAIGGSVIPGVGNAVGAVLGGLVGATGGAIGWLFSTAGDADAAQKKIDQARADHAGDLCNNANNFADDIKNCFAEYCPELSDWANGELAVMLAQMGC